MIRSKYEGYFLFPILKLLRISPYLEGTKDTIKSIILNNKCVDQL